MDHLMQGRSQDFSKGGGVTPCQTEGTHQFGQPPEYCRLFA